MKALVLNQFGDTHQFQIEDIKQPHPGKGQVLIQVKAIGINPLDTKVRKGSNRIAKNMGLPAVIGWDVSGIISACGEAVTDFKEGDEVFGCIGFPAAGGAYASYAISDTKDIALKPKALSFEEAAAIPIAGLTAFQAINEHLNIQSGEKLLLQAAAGGVGHLALQIAKMKGAFVIGTASEKNSVFLQELGIDQMVNYKEEKFEDYAKQVDAVLDAMGGEVLYRSIRCVKEGGKVLCLPSSTKNDQTAIDLAKTQKVSMNWSIMYSDAQQLQQIAEWIAEKKIKIHIHKVFPFEEMGKAHQEMETHSVRGKIVVKGE